MITSTQNNQVKDWKKLHAKKHRQKSKKFLIEGFHLIEEAYESDWDIDTIIVQEGINAPEWMSDDAIEVVDERVFKHIAQTETPQGIAAVVNLKNVPRVNETCVLLVDAIQDPGNLGTIIRTADAAGFSSIGLGTGTVDPFNEKVIRASQGSIFHLPIFETNLLDEINKLKQNDFTIWASALQGAKNYLHAEVSNKIALIVGNEGAGVNPDIIEVADEIVKIPIYGQAESLNVSIAAGIFMYHVRNYLLS